MHPDVQKLLEVQRVDQDIARLRRDLDSLPNEEARRRKSLDTVVGRHETAKSALQEAEVSARTNESGIKQSDEEIKKLQERLNIVKNNAEYQATLFQIESVRTERGRLEEEGLALIDRIEELKNVVEEAARVRESEQSVFDEFIQKASTLRGERETQLARVGSGRDALLADISPEWVAKYDRLFEARDSLAVCAVEGVTCMGCYTSIPPNLQVKLQSGSAVVQCDACQRILYMPE